jgi:hypothetical protein
MPPKLTWNKAEKIGQKGGRRSNGETAAPRLQKRNREMCRLSMKSHIMETKARNTKQVKNDLDCSIMFRLSIVGWYVNFKSTAKRTLLIAFENDFGRCHTLIKWVGTLRCWCMATLALKIIGFRVETVELQPA